MERTARCSCGQLSVIVDGDPEAHGICSCLECQKQTGSAFHWAGYWPKAAVRGIEGRATVWRRSSDAGRWTDTSFCPECGSAVYFYLESAPDYIGVSIGNLTDPNFPPPQFSGWQRYKHPWVVVPQNCTEMETQ
jgi:hypothetical protein